MKARRGFTTVELVIAIALIGILSAMTIVSISAMVSIQNSASTSANATEQADQAKRKIADYVSFLSVKNSSCSFSYASSTNGSISFQNTIDSALYSLSFAEKTLSLSTTYTGSEDYLNYHFSESYSAIDSIAFSYDNTIGLLTATITPNGATALTHVYSLEVLK